MLFVMAYAMRLRQCSNCGDDILGSLSPTKDVLCIECAVKKACQHMAEMRNKSGPGYDRWLQGMANAVAKAHADRLG